MRLYSIWSFFASLLFFLLASCGASRKDKYESKELYKSDDLIITQISEHCFIHTSYLETESWGKVACNGLIIAKDGEALVYDTPVDSITSEDLIRYVSVSMKSKIKAVIPTHFHVDCLGGLGAFHAHDITSIAHQSTIEYACERGFPLPQHGFDTLMIVTIGGDMAVTKFYGAGHTRDNVVGNFPVDNVMFGGCLIKEIGATKGNLADADTLTWSQTVSRIKSDYPTISKVVPGHGQYGAEELLDYTIELFR